MLRKIHLDFHTSTTTERVGEAFDPDEFAQTLADANVNALVTPGRCQFGHVYYDAKIAPPHPHLVRPELFPETVKACVKRGIRVQAYFTLGLDDYAAALHPDWRQRLKDGTQPQWGAKHICLATPYLEEIVLPQVIEMIERCPGIYGFWFDICLYIGGAFYSDGFNRLAKARLGGNADDELSRWSLGRTLVRESCLKIDQIVQERLPGAENYFNSLVNPGEPENIALQPIQEVENPFTFNGPEVMTAHARWFRVQGWPIIGLVSRFNGPWMDPGTIRSADQMRFDVGRVVSLGCQPSMGDHRHPDGTLDPIVYRRLAPIYAEIKQCEPFLDVAKPMREAVLLSQIDRAHGQLLPGFPPSTLQAARLLEETEIQFDVCSIEEPIPETDLIIWPGSNVPASPALREALEAHVRRGGAVLGMGSAADGCESIFGIRRAKLSEENVQATSTINPGGHVIRESPNDTAQKSGHFFRLIPEIDSEGFAHGIPGGVHPFSATAEHQTLAHLHGAASMDPPFALKQIVGPAIVQRGQVIYSAINFFALDLESSNASMGPILSRLCDRLLPRRLVRHDASPTVAVHLHKTPNGFVLHLLHWAMGRWTPKMNPPETFPPVGPIRLEMNLDGQINHAVLEPAGVELPIISGENRISVTIPAFRVWQILRLLS